MPWQTIGSEICQHVKDPGDFRLETIEASKLDGDAVRLVKVNFALTEAMASDVTMLMGKLSSEKVPAGHDPDTMVLQSMRWASKSWTLPQAKRWWSESTYSTGEPWPDLAKSVTDTDQRMGVEVKSFPTEFKVDAKKRIVEGYASVFGVEDSWGDIVERGAFEKTLAERGQRIKACYQHDWFDPIGRPEVIEEDSKGLYTKTYISETTLGNDVLTLLQDTVITEMSFGYTPVKYTWEDRDPDGEDVDRVRHLEEVILFEYSYVTWAANELALVTGVKAQTELLPALEQFRTLMAEIKGGRMLPTRSAAMVREAVKALQALLDASGVSVEPGRPTPAPVEPSGAADVASASEPLRHSFAELTRVAEGIGAVANNVQLRDDLRTFGRDMREEVHGIGS